MLAGALPLALTASLAIAVPAANAADPIDGAQTSGDVLFPNVGNGGYDALHYDIQLSWTQADPIAQSTIVATTTMTATAPVPLQSFSLDFEGLEIDSVKVNGEAATYTRDIDAAAIKYKLIITPATPVSGEFTTEVQYHGTPSRHQDTDGSWEGWSPTADGATMLGQPIGSMTGFPHNNTPNDKSTYKIALDIPNQITNAAGTGSAAALSIGELVSSAPTAGSGGERRTWTWERTLPTASELVIISIGKYDMITSQVTLSDGRVIPEWSFMDSALSAANKNTIVSRRAQLGTIIRNLETIYGPFPGNSTGVVIDTVPGINYALETEDRSFYTSANSVNGNTLIHELVHSWYGNNVSPRVWNDLWINEGMATWGPTYYNTNEAFGTNTTPVETTYYNTWNTTAAGHARWTIPPAGMTDPYDLYDWQSYTRGALVWTALKVAIGDTAFFALIKEWQSRYAGTSRGTTEFIALAEELSGKDLTAFFQDWVYDADKPAWPEKLSLALTSDPVDGVVEPGDEIEYTLTATNTGRIPLAASEVSVDLSEVLTAGSLDEDTLPAGLTIAGTTLTWAVPATAVDGSATATFTVTVDPLASDTVLSAAATVTTLGGTCTSCTTTHSVDLQPVSPSAAPVVSGTPAVGQVLTAAAPGWAAGAEFAYQWTIDGAEVEGATAATFELTPAALGKEVTVKLTGSKTGYSPVTTESTPVGPVVLGTITVVPTPTIIGSTTFGKTLTASPGTWAAGTTLAYQWNRNGVAIPGATKSTYKLAVADVAKTITISVTGSQPGYADVKATSAATPKVVKAAFSAKAKVKIKGTKRVGKKLTAKTTGWGKGVKVKYRWYAGKKKVGKNKRTLKLTKKFVGKKIRVKITVTKPGFVTKKKASKATVKVKKKR